MPSPAEIAVLAQIVHGHMGRAPLPILWLLAGRSVVEAMCAPGPGALLAVWSLDRPEATLTPLAAELLGVELAERLVLTTVEDWRDGEWVEVETIAEVPYWAASPPADRAGSLPPALVDDPAFGRVPAAPTSVQLPERRGEYPLPFAELAAAAEAGELPRHRRRGRRAG